LRLAALKNQSVQELSIFSMRPDERACNGGYACPRIALVTPSQPNANSTWPGHFNPDKKPMCSCSSKWFQFATDPCK
jgi:hypothetical protein